MVLNDVVLGTFKRIENQQPVGDACRFVVCRKRASRCRKQPRQNEQHECRSQSQGLILSLRIQLTVPHTGNGIEDLGGDLTVTLLDKTSLGINFMRRNPASGAVSRSGRRQGFSNRERQATGIVRFRAPDFDRTEFARFRSPKSYTAFPQINTANLEHVPPQNEIKTGIGHRNHVLIANCSLLLLCMATTPRERNRGYEKSRK
jgi:hypothetical protein